MGNVTGPSASDWEAVASQGDVDGARRMFVASLQDLAGARAMFIHLAEALLRNDPIAAAHVREVEILLGFADSPGAIAGNGAEAEPLRAKMILGHMYRGLGRLTEACAAFRCAYDWRPDLDEPAGMLIQVLQDSGNAAGAAEVLREHSAIKLQPITSLPRWTRPETSPDAVSLYLDLLEKVVCNWIYGDASHPSYGDTKFDPARREIGRDLPVQAHSMIGLRRLRHLRCAVEAVIDEDISGDFLEAGVWRGGACILMKGVLAARGVNDRRVYVADSFQGLPPPDERFQKDLATLHDFFKRPELAASLESVRANFEKYGLLDDRVVFVEGLFKDTLPGLDVDRLAVLRLDGDLYASTIDTLEALYDKVSPGGFVICDDYGAVLDARRAVLDFRASRKIEAPMTAIDSDGVFWRKEP